MEPKDLKNSEELKSPGKEGLKKENVENSTSESVEQESAKVVEPEEKVIEEEKVEATLSEDKEAEPQEEAVAEEKVEEKEVVAEEKQAVNEEKVEEVSQEKKEEAETPAEKPEEIKAEETSDEPKTDEEKPVVEVKEKKVEKIDYIKYSQIELVNAMRDVLQEYDSRDIKGDIDAIKAAFYKNLKDAAEAAKKDFIEAGGAEEEFKAEEDPYENDIKDLQREYRQLRIERSKRLENEKEDNLQKKYEVIEKIKGLINNEESINKTFNEFRALQQEWRDIGLVPQSEMKNLWDTYHFNVENFYDYIKINRELRDLDLKKNLEAKIKLCEKAEELLLDPSIIRAFNTLQKYHEQWREIGPVPREQKDDIWERFKAATTTINKNHQQFFEDRKLEQKKNLEAKTALCEKVEAINENEIDSHKEWDKFSKELIELQKVWRTIGFAPRKDNNKIYERFRSACDTFFDAKTRILC